MSILSKQDYQEKLFDIMNPVLPHYRADNTRILLGYTGAGYSEDVAEIEGFARILWGFAPFLSGGGTNQEFEKIYLQGLTNGADPDNPNYWGDASDGNQLLVEMAALAVSLLLAPQKLWEPLSKEAKTNVTNWLSIINSRELKPANWQFFGVLVNVALLKLGSDKFSQEKLSEGLANINSYYVGDGWYSDGLLQTFDYYSAFAMQYYGLIYSVFMETEDPENCKAFKERAALFGKQFIYWFDATGAAVPYGRSLTYRFAQSAFYSACLFAGVEPLDMAVMKGIISRNLEFWWQSHMKDFSGILTIGYTYPNLVMAETYNAPGSPLWALKAFLLLALDDNHPFWNLDAAPLPQLDTIKTLKAPQMIVSHNGDFMTLFPGGFYRLPIVLGHLEEKYAKFAYSTKFGFSVHKANDCLENMAPDSDLVFEIGGLFFGRTRATSVQVVGQTIVTQWSPFPGIDVTTVIIPSAHGHTRQHTIVSSLKCTAYDCGFSFPLEYDNYSYETDDNTAHVQSDFGSCTVYVYSPNGGGKTNGIIIQASANTNLVFPRTVIPAVSQPIDVGTTNIITSVITN